MLGTDSTEYEVFKNFINEIKDIEGMTCEIGVRLGGGSDHIITALFENMDFGRTHVMIDPFGNIEYETSEGVVTTHDYTNLMRDKALLGLYGKYQDTPINLQFFNMEDTEFFKRFPDGVPVYSTHKKLLTKYALVHFDGPHAILPLKVETEFFNDRLADKCLYVFDDIFNYDHTAFEAWLFEKVNAELKFKGTRKAVYLIWGKK